MRINPWRHIWFHPKNTMRWALENSPTRLLLLLASVAGILQALGVVFSLQSSYPDKMLLHSPLFIALIGLLGIGLGIFHLYLGGWLYQLTGSWLGGKGTFKQLKAAVGWSFYPLAVAAALNLVTLFIPTTNSLLYVPFALLYLVVAVWSFIILFNLIAAAHQFSAWKGFFTLLIGVFLLLVALALIALLTPLIAPLIK